MSLRPFRMDSVLVPCRNTRTCGLPCLFHIRIFHQRGMSQSHLSTQGLQKYLETHSDRLCVDLNQNPEKRPRHSGVAGSLHTVTTGCSRLWSMSAKRVIHGIELLHAHGFELDGPLALQTGDLSCWDVFILSLVHICFDQPHGLFWLCISSCVSTKTLSRGHSALCKLAGNSMHAAAIGRALISAIFFCTRVNHAGADM